MDLSLQDPIQSTLRYDISGHMRGSALRWFVLGVNFCFIMVTKRNVFLDGTSLVSETLGDIVHLGKVYCP